ncbi:MAG: hypothetical protein GF416_02555 [Candidatus Altiarchaeales archaeon]|nr:hypothetical protein [Candidatus Altiarchaeales archaeon]MBD3416000.1 hypothetical protein [Candidatus Altiarchaeales archaeon]
MVAPSKRTRSTKKVRRKTPGGKNTTLFRRAKSAKPRCGRCGKQLSGMASGTATEMKSFNKSSKVPARPYAGVLCTDCLDGLVRYVTRMEAKHKESAFADLNLQRDLTLEKYLPRGWWGEVSAGKVSVKKDGKKPAGKRTDSKSKAKTVKKKAKKKA